MKIKVVKIRAKEVNKTQKFKSIIPHVVSVGIPTGILFGFGFIYQGLKQGSLTSWVQWLMIFSFWGTFIFVWIIFWKVCGKYIVEKELENEDQGNTLSD